MEKICLVEKLKGSVTGDAPIFGQLEMIIAGTSNLKTMFLSTLPNEESVVSGNNGIVFTNSTGTSELSNPFTLTSDRFGFLVQNTNDAKMTVTNKYKLKCLYVEEYYKYGYYNIKEFIGGIDNFIYSIPENTSYLILKSYGSKMDISDVVPKMITLSSSIIAFDFSNSPLIEGNINVFRNINNLKRIDVGSCPLVNGTIADLKSITTLENIACAYTQVGGTIEEFVAGQRAAGRTTGTVSGNSAGWGIVTFDGATTHAKGAVSWTATTITMDGVTINA